MLRLESLERHRPGSDGARTPAVWSASLGTDATLVGDVGAAAVPLMLSRQLPVALLGGHVDGLTLR